MSKLFIITGTSKGLGEAMAKRVIQKGGHKVIGLSRKQVSWQVSEELFDHQYVDLSKPIDGKLIDKIQAYLTSTKNVVFVNNAGVIDPIGRIGTLSSNQINASILVNITSPIILINLIAGCISKKQNGIFINITSGAAKRAIDKWSIYSASKAALISFFNVFQLENPNWNVENIDPGVLNTDMQKHIRSVEFEGVDEFKRYYKEGELKSPEKAADEILYKYI